MAKAKKTKRPRGRQSRISKAQVEFLTSFKPQWEVARSAKEKLAMSTFYDVITTDFLKKFPDADFKTTDLVDPTGPGQSVISFLPPVEAGPSTSTSGSSAGSHTTPLPTSLHTGSIPTDASSNSAVPTNPSTPNLLIDPALIRPSEERTTSTPDHSGQTTVSTSSTTTTSLRKKASLWSQARHVSFGSLVILRTLTHFLQFIVGWFHHHSKKLTKSNAQDLIAQITDAATQKPVKDRVLIAYQRKYYNERIRPRYEQYLQDATTRWSESVAAGNTEGCKEPVPMSLRNKAAKDMWDEEGEEFQEKFVAELDAEYRDALNGFLSRNQSPSTPEEYHKYVLFCFLTCAEF